MSRTKEAVLAALNSSTNLFDACEKIGVCQSRIYIICRQLKIEGTPGQHLNKTLPTIAAPTVEKPVAPIVAMIASDFHVPYHNVAIVDLFIQKIVVTKPNLIILNGDIMDCAAISSFDKAPDTALLQTEIDETIAILRRIRAAAGSACEIVYLEGNHEARLHKWLVKNPGLWGMTCLTMPKLLELAEMQIKWLAYGKLYRNERLVAYHGKAVSRHSAYTAKAEMDKLRISDKIGLSGHTHRLGWHVMTDDTGTSEWWESGCLADIDQADYMIGLKNWQNGWLYYIDGQVSPYIHRG